MKAWRWLVWFGALGAPVTACGPDQRQEPCDGPSFWLTVRAAKGPLPADTRLTIRYGGNPDGELYDLAHPRKPQAVRCTKVPSTNGTSASAPSDNGAGGAESADGAESAGGAAGGADSEVWSLQCGLYTQGPARIDVSAEGYEPIEDQAVSFESERHCEVEVTVDLVPAKPPKGG